MKKIILLCSMVLVAAVAVFAGFWDWATPYQGPERDVITLVITGNYKSSRAMADVIQYESRQPYILLPYKGAKGIFFCPAGPNASALEIPAEQLIQFIGFLDPQRIIILGNEDYVPGEYRKLLEFNGFSPVTFSGDWNKVAQDVAGLMHLQRLENNYKQVMASLQSNYIPNQGKELSQPNDVVIVEQNSL